MIFGLEYMTLKLTCCQLSGLEVHPMGEHVVIPSSFRTVRNAMPQKSPLEGKAYCVANYSMETAETFDVMFVFVTNGLAQ
jgi:hypothetical protein